MLGTVVVDDWGGLPESAQRRWRATYVARDGHGHVHGANAGLRLDTYLAVGGFADLDRDEDVALAAATAHRRVVRTGEHPGRHQRPAAQPGARRLRRAPRPAGLTVRSAAGSRGQCAGSHGSGSTREALT